MPAAIDAGLASRVHLDGAVAARAPIISARRGRRCGSVRRARRDSGRWKRDDNAPHTLAFPKLSFRVCTPGIMIRTMQEWQELEGGQSGAASRAEHRSTPAADGGNRRPRDGVRICRPARSAAPLHRLGRQEQRRRGCCVGGCRYRRGVNPPWGEVKKRRCRSTSTWCAFEAAFEIGAKPVDENVVEAVLSLRIDDLESRTTRSGHDVRSLAEQFDATRAEICRLLRGDLARSIPRTDGRDARGGTANLIGWHRASAASIRVASQRVCVRRTASVSAKMRRKGRSIARWDVHHCAPQS